MAETLITTTFYEGAGEKFRVETASSFHECAETKRARKIFLDRTSELREIAYWDENGKIEEGGAANKPMLRLEVEEVFQKASRGENPCNKPEPQKGVQASQM